MKRLNVKLLASDIAECALFVALMTVGANVSIPFFPVPLTFQTVICVLSGLLLGWKKGVISMSVYLVAGLIGIPVFTSFGCGVAYVVKPSFGYIIGFILSSFTAGIIGGRKGLPFRRYVVASLSAFIVNYAVGIPYFALVWQFYMHSPSLGKYIIEYNLLYMPKDLVLCILASILAWRVIPYIDRGRSKLKERSLPQKHKD